MDSTNDFGSFSEGSNPSRSTRWQSADLIFTGNLLNDQEELSARFSAGHCSEETTNYRLPEKSESIRINSF